MSMTFKQALEIKDPVFESILQIMKIGRGEDRFDIDKERRFLSVVNQILDYYMVTAVLFHDNECPVKFYYIKRQLGYSHKV